MSLADSRASFGLGSTSFSGRTDLAFPPLRRVQINYDSTFRAFGLFFHYQAQAGNGAVAHGFQDFFLRHLHQVAHLVVEFDGCTFDVLRHRFVVGDVALRHLSLRIPWASIMFLDFRVPYFPSPPIHS